MRFLRKHQSHIAWAFLFLALVYTRFVGLDWGLPFPMHPDEWNMARSVQELGCIPGQWSACFDPHFYAYGQLPLYVARILIAVFRPLFGVSGPISLGEAVIALRILSAVVSVVLVNLMWRSYELVVPRHSQRHWHAFLFVFTPGLIQFAHFGTTETILMMLYVALLNWTIHAYQDARLKSGRYLISCSALLGVACAVKVSSAVFAIPVVFSYLLFTRQQLSASQRVGRELLARLQVLIAAAFVFVLLFAICSPHYLIHWQDALSSVRYESDVALGRLPVFYTRAFFATIPGLYPLVAIFPVVFGLPLYVGLPGLLLYAGLRRIRLPAGLWFVVLFAGSYFFATWPLYTKWTRFLAPIYPLIIVGTTVVFAQVWSHSRHLFVRLVLAGFFVGMLIPGISYLRIYETPDVRFVASSWMDVHVPADSLILSETANVVDVPVHESSYDGPRHAYRSVSFNFYDLDTDSQLQQELLQAVQEADYIIVPTRRLFANHWCPTDTSHVALGWPRTLVSWGYERDRCARLRKQYPILNAYYDDLFSGALGFDQVAQFSSSPRIEVGGMRVFALPDEQYDETWSVFDHPVIRIFKRRSPAQ